MHARSLGVIAKKEDFVKGYAAKAAVFMVLR